MDGIAPELGKIGQVGIVVKDIRRAMEYLWGVHGIGPWRGYYMGPERVRGVVYRGRPATYRTIMAVASAGPVNIELIQYLEGDSIHRDFLESRGEGVNHLGVFVQDLQVAQAAMEARGYHPIQGAIGLGKEGDGGYVYMDTEGSCGTIMELIKRGTGTMEPDFVYPEAPR